MSIGIAERKTKVVFKRENETVHVSMRCDVSDKAHLNFERRISRERGLLCFAGQEIKGSLYDLINASIKDYFKKESRYPLEVKLLNFEKPEDDLLNIMKNVYCKGEESSLPVEYEVHLHKEDLFDCKDCG